MTGMQSEAVGSQESISFRDLGLGSDLQAAVSLAGYETPTAIQAGAIPLLLAGKDIIGQARTGTGKTAAFALPMLEGINPSQREVQGLVLTPTRELAIQIAEAMETYASQTKGLKVVAIYGGQSIVEQLKALKRGVHVVVGTPGRVLDHIRRRSLKLGSVKSLVLDEADEMLRMGFIDDVEAIIAETPAERGTALFSATMPRQIQAVAKRHMDSPQQVRITTAQEERTIEERYIRVRGHQKDSVLDRLLRAGDHEGVIVFARRRVDTEELAVKISAQGHRTAALNGDMSQEQREQVVNRFRDRKLDVVVGTDVAARGLDVDHIGLVINYDIPDDVTTYTHRIGRTGRAGREGIAVSLVSGRQMAFLRQVERDRKVQVKSMPIPSLEEIQKREAEAHKQKILDLLADPPEELNVHYGLVKSLVDEGIHMTQVAAAASFLAAGAGVKEEEIEEYKPYKASSHRNSSGGRRGRSRGHRKGGRRNSKSRGHRGKRN